MDTGSWKSKVDRCRVAYFNDLETYDKVLAGHICDTLPSVRKQIEVSLKSARHDHPSRKESVRRTLRRVQTVSDASADIAIRLFRAVGDIVVWTEIHQTPTVLSNDTAGSVVDQLANLLSGIKKNCQVRIQRRSAFEFKRLEAAAIHGRLLKQSDGRPPPNYENRDFDSLVREHAKREILTAEIDMLEMRRECITIVDYFLKEHEWLVKAVTQCRAKLGEGPSEDTRERALTQSTSSYIS